MMSGLSVMNLLKENAIEKETDQIIKNMQNNHKTGLLLTRCLVLAGLIASGKTTIKEVEHILRGYDNIVGKLNAVGAKLSIEEY